ncbi:UDENN domain-containing protein [Entamoeba marina]
MNLINSNDISEPLLTAFFIYDNDTKTVITSVPHTTTSDPQIIPLLFPTDPPMDSQFLVVLANSSYCYVCQTLQTTHVLIAPYHHWSFYRYILHHTYDQPQAQRVLFLSSLHRLHPTQSLTHITYPQYNFTAIVPHPLSQPTSGHTSVLLRLPTSALLQLQATILSERRHLFISRNPELLTTFITALLELLSPLLWQHTIIPHLPPTYQELLDAPTPFIIGSLPDYVPTSFNSHIVLVDLDNLTLRSNDLATLRNDLTNVPKKWKSDLSFILDSSRSIVDVEERNDKVKTGFQNFNTHFVNDIEVAVNKVVKDGKVLDLKKFREDYFVFGDERKFYEMLSRTAAFDQYVLKVEKRILKEGVKVIKRKSLFSSSSNLIDLDNFTVVKQVDPPNLFTFY